jgi:hypothetical protein
MPHELIYTSAPRGLKPGATGYCTVAHTPDLPKDLAEQLEGISHYRHLRVDDPTGNPIAFSHSVLTTGYQVHHVLSRVADSGLDHSGRSNFLAHHVVFDPDALPDTGPAWLCEQRLFVQKWDRSPSLVPNDRAIPSGHAEARPCTKWAKLTGDAGWGGVLAAATNAAEPAYLIYEPGQDVLGLLAESMALLPPEARWGVTFNTYFTGKAVRTTCQWRCVTADSAEAREALAARRGVVIRLDQDMSGSPSGPLVEAARTGQVERAVPQRRTPPAAPVRSSRPVAEDLPAPAVRPTRSRPSEPLPEPDDSQYDMPVPAASRGASGRGGVVPLLLGIFLGGLLLLAFTSLVELAAGKSLLSFAVESSELKQARKDKETAEGEAAARSVELERERKAAEAAKTDLRGQIRDRQQELKVLQEKYEALNREVEELRKTQAPEAKGAGLFMTARDRIRELNRQQELRTAQGKIDTLQKQIDGLMAKLANAGGGATAGTIPVGRLDKVQLGGQPTVQLFRVKLPAEAKPKLDVFGLPPDIKPTALGDGERVLLKSQETGFDATLSIGKDGMVRIDGMNMEKHPLLGLAVIRVNPGTGDEPVYRQLFWPAQASAAGLEATLAKGAAAEGRNRKYAFRYDTRAGNLKSEIESLKAASQLAGRNGRVTINKKAYDLELSADPLTLENRPTDEEPTLKLKVDGGEFIIDVTFADATGIPDRVQIDALEIVRVIPANKEKSFPGCTQELLRLSPK